jgi:hypothetical protein
VNERSGPPGWFMLLVLLAIVAGVALAFWLYGALT